MTRILSIDASTEACSVALLNNHEVTERYKIAPREHARLLLPMVEELLGDSQLSLSQLDAVACNIGPGAFTGIRIAVSVAQGLAYGANLPAIGLSTLENLAAYGYDTKGLKSWLCAIDARMNEIYFAAFVINEQKLPERVNNEQVVAPDLVDFNESEGKFDFGQFGLIGSGWRAYYDILSQNKLLAEDADNYILLDDFFPRAKYGLKQAEAMVAEGLLLKPEELQPAYLRNNVAKKKLSKK